MFFAKCCLTYGSASTLKKNLKPPVVWTPKRNCRLTLAPGANGVPSVIVLVVALLLNPPPKGCAGGVSSVVPTTVMLQGVVAKPAAVHVAASLTLTVTLLELNNLRSATPPDTKAVLMSTTRMRNLVTGAPVLFWKRRLIDIVPAAAFGPMAVVSRTRFGVPEADFDESSRNVTTSRVNRGLPRFCGPGAPNR